MALSVTTSTPSGWANDAAYANYQKAQQIAGQPYQGYSGNMLAGWNQGQQSGYNAALNGMGVGQGAMAQAQQAAGQAAAFQPTQVQAGGYQPAMQGVMNTPAASAGNATSWSVMNTPAANAGAAAQMTAASAGPAAQMQAQQAALAQAKAAALARGDIRDVSAQNFTQADLSKYMNPYTGAVIDTTLNTLGRQRDVLQNQANAQAAKAGAFGGSRQAIMNSENNRSYLDTAAQTVAGLNNTNFNQAMSAIQTDQNRDLQAQLANQSQDWNVGNLNTSNAQQTALQNMLAANQTNQYNASNRQAASQWNAGATNQQNQYNAGLTQQAGLANQAATNSRADLNAGFAQQANLATSAAHNSAAAQQASNANQMSQYNAGLAQQANLATSQAHNAALTNQAAAANQAAQFNADLDLRGQLANQSAGQNAVNTRLSAANALNGMGLDQQTQYLNGANSAFNMGQARTQYDQAQLTNQYQQWAAQQAYPAQQLAMLQSGLAGVPFGQTTVAPGQASNSAANWLSGVTGAAQIAANGADIVSGAKDLYGGAKAALSLLPW